jgi:hypothetical protein
LVLVEREGREKLKRKTNGPPKAAEAEHGALALSMKGAWGDETAYRREPRRLGGVFAEHGRV